MSDKTGKELLIMLLRQSANGNRAAFSRLYELTCAKLFGITIRILGRSDLAEEALQECYVAIWQRAADFAPERSSPISWMATIARNKAIDKKRLKAERISADGMELDDGFISDIAGPLEDTLRSEQLQALTDCLKELPEERRQMILLAYLQGYSREEIATQFSRPVATVKTILRRSLAALKGCLDGR